MHCEAKSVIIPLLTEGYRSGHNGAVLKTVRAKVHRGSNPLPSAIICENLTNSGGVFYLLRVTIKAHFLMLFFRRLNYNSEINEMGKKMPEHKLENIAISWLL